MTRWFPLAARSAMITLALAFAATAAPLAAQQNQTAEPAVSAQAAAPAAAPATSQDAGPRVDNSMSRVQPKVAASRTSSMYQDNVYVNRSYLIYILVAAILIVLLIVLIRKA